MLGSKKYQVGLTNLIYNPERWAPYLVKAMNEQNGLPNLLDLASTGGAGAITNQGLER
jgi:hypothetical protein